MTMLRTNNISRHKCRQFWVVLSNKNNNNSFFFLLPRSLCLCQCYGYRTFGTINLHLNGQSMPRILFTTFIHESQKTKGIYKQKNGSAQQQKKLRYFNSHTLSATFTIQFSQTHEHSLCFALYVCSYTYINQ